MAETAVRIGAGGIIKRWEAPECPLNPLPFDNLSITAGLASVYKGSSEAIFFFWRVYLNPELKIREPYSGSGLVLVHWSGTSSRICRTRIEGCWSWETDYIPTYSLVTLMSLGMMVWLDPERPWAALSSLASPLIYSALWFWVWASSWIKSYFHLSFIPTAVGLLGSLVFLVFCVKWGPSGGPTCQELLVKKKLSL